MGKKLEYTPRSFIRSAIRRYVWLRSRERAKRLKMDGYTCQHCGKKQSKAKGRIVKVEVHHKHGIANWEKLIDIFYECLLVDPENLETLCAECHKKGDK